MRTLVTGSAGFMGGHVAELRPEPARQHMDVGGNRVITVNELAGMAAVEFGAEPWTEDTLELPSEKTPVPRPAGGRGEKGSRGESSEP